MLNTVTILKESGVQFGTSGARGLVSEFSIDVCSAFTYSFIKTMKHSFSFGKVAIAIDNRPSSYEMAQACAAAIEASGLAVNYYGIIPTPALAYMALQDQVPAIMVTGSHIPFDRNGLKFYRPDGEITKADEQSILSSQVDFSAPKNLPELVVDSKAARAYIDRYTSVFDTNLLFGKRIGVYEHSSAGRDIYQELFESLGAEVISLERTDEFIPIDTEAVGEADKTKARAWSKDYQLDFIFSTDGDGDRPLVADEKGEWLRGDILGLLCAEAMKIESLAVPISCNTVISESSVFKKVNKTKIGSPYVIAEFDLLANAYDTVAGFEANGGFLLGSSVNVNGKLLKALPTRDAVLPALMLLYAAQDRSIVDMVQQLPKRYTHSDRIQNFATEKSLKILDRGRQNPNSLLLDLGFEEQKVQDVDTTDGLRLTLKSGMIVHLRASGNAPELRCYAEADTFEQARVLVNKTLLQVQQF
ncbi:phosphomannomutase [Vibrio parahaemolyticus]|uniref:Phosphomannomutase n=1 Tax=Vibrio parahaemolyticus TaxID=670 RepID=A0A5P5X5L5_VIBPH|nr:phosphomannomutase [Vibrio parahaemolyticus]QFF90520.1 phosphomannomutase [Vibrio parahaemolyticus]